ncbi:hypothetical protein ACQJBY_030407 [Aegilops geniculata]
MDLATGAIGSLLPKLELLNELNLEKSIRSDVGCVIEDLRVMHVDLCNVSEVQRDNNNEQLKLVKRWADEVRELSYVIEDAVDGFLMPVEGSEPATSTGGLMGLIQKMMSLFKLGRTNHPIGGTIKDIKNQVQHKSVSKGKYKVEEVVANTISTINARPLCALAKDGNKLVGINGAMKDLTKRLKGADGNGDRYGQVLKVHSIFGSGGLGKTTLARAVYDQLKGSFRLTAFVPVGRNPNVKKLLYDILFELDEQRYLDLKPAELDKRQLMDVLKNLLRNNRYLIVLDDLWGKKVWNEKIKLAFVDSKCGSKIIITTRIFEVATIATDVYKLDPLLTNYSKQLFYETLFGEEGMCEYDVADEVIEKILSKCGGVPLAIITIASLLASKERDDWPKVYNSIGFGPEVNEDADSTREILLFSYSDLPRHLRTCLLHLSIFPEERVIEKDAAIWKWVAEGFVHEEPGKGLFELGESYFNQLVSRSMIQLVVDPFVEEISFGIHDLVLDMICSLSKDENFVTVLETDEQHTSSKINARRLAVRMRNIEQPDPPITNCMVQLRSFYATDCHIGVMPPLSGFKVLRVLSLEKCTLIKDQPYELEHIGKLLQLRYLGLKSTPICKLPEEIGDLLFLQTLILDRTEIEELPHSVGLLRQLKCLRVRTNGELSVPDWIVNMTSLEDLSLVGFDMLLPPVFAEGLSKLKELRNLEIEVCLSSDDWGRALVKSIGNLCELQSLQLFAPQSLDHSMTIWEGFVPPVHLHSMTMHVGFSNVPPWMDSPHLSSLVKKTHLPSLSFLQLTLCNMEAHCLDILGRLPVLHTLKLNTPMGGWLAVRGSGAFPKLRHLCSSTMLKFQKGVMPRLEYLELEFSVLKLKEAKFDCDFTSLGNLPLLQKVGLIVLPWTGEVVDPEYVKRMEAAVMHALDTHPHRCPVLHLHGLEEYLLHGLEGLEGS